MAIGSLTIDDKTDVNKITSLIGNTDISSIWMGGGGLTDILKEFSLDKVEGINDIHIMPDPPIPGIFRVMPPIAGLPYDYGILIIFTSWDRKEATTLFMATGTDHSLYYTNYNSWYTGSPAWGPWQTVSKPS